MMTHGDLRSWRYVLQAEMVSHCQQDADQQGDGLEVARCQREADQQCNEKLEQPGAPSLMIYATLQERRGWRTTRDNSVLAVGLWCNGYGDALQLLICHNEKWGAAGLHVHRDKGGQTSGGTEKKLKWKYSMVWKDTISQLPQRWCNYCTTFVEPRYVSTYFQGGAIIAPPCCPIPMYKPVEMSLAYSR